MQMKYKEQERAQDADEVLGARKGRDGDIDELPLHF
jgi:hypothetical protein